MPETELTGYAATIRFPLHWGEMDALGHANNARFFSWFESARVAFYRKLDLGATLPAGAGPIVATTSCTYLRPIVYPAELVVGLRVARIGRTSLHFEHAVALGHAPQAIAATGAAVIVLLDYASGAKLPVPDAMRARLLELDPRTAV